MTPAKYKEDYPYLKEVDSLALANAQLNLQGAFKNCFSKSRKKMNGFPSFSGVQTPGLPFHISMGSFSLDKEADLLNLRHAIQTETQEKFPWTPHCTIIIDEAETVQKALPILARRFQPFMGRITKLHLCAFWPKREIATVFLEND